MNTNGGEIANFSFPRSEHETPRGKVSIHHHPLQSTFHHPQSTIHYALAHALGTRTTERLSITAIL